ncbi:MAG: hypothetical protein NZ530_07800 [Thermodesulfobacteriaceae bacterium]|nr:hypothetical protein [Thermodesulfobacteriaceae bacterium]MDW8136146.1 hypothetical protein [Thermodesulfobacterium sp.]
MIANQRIDEVVIEMGKLRAEIEGSCSCKLDCPKLGNNPVSYNKKLG